MNVSILKRDIEHCREEMVQLAIKTSMSDQRVIETSKRLDHLLNLYSKVSTKCS
ncbi:aspartyl-phosphate phosphatase Spo0E family protein [Mesobacillus maritimus]|uniref:aspartyl-phosphate phosphatase Spo0E family protein n=1 Tax=Mesobacillus maritimus TaxID=1643336 RepID=UPI00384C473D